MIVGLLSLSCYEPCGTWLEEGGGKRGKGIVGGREGVVEAKVVVVCGEEGLAEVKGRRGLHVCDFEKVHKTSIFGTFPKVN